MSEPARPPIVVAIDGPAGSGKSSVSKAAARALGFGYLDTGAAYRALAWLALERGVDTDGRRTPCVALLDDFDYAIGTDPDDYCRAGGRHRRHRRDPRAAGHRRRQRRRARARGARRTSIELFRGSSRRAAQPGIVVEGRDITTVVAPDAAGAHPAHRRRRG